MLEKNLISQSIIPVKLTDKGHLVIGMMDDNDVKHLPVVKDGKLLGIISDKSLMDNDMSRPINICESDFIKLSVSIHDHVYDVLRLLAEHELTLIPISDPNDNYLGAVTMQNLINYFAKTGAFSEPGAIIVLEMNRRDYSLAQLARIVEEENAAVLSTFISSPLDSRMIEVTFKINKQNIEPIIASFERFGYTVKASFFETEYIDTLKERYDALMEYLNV